MKISSAIAVLSIVVYMLSLLQPACSCGWDGHMLTGYVVLTAGWISLSITWLANIFLILSWIIYFTKTSPRNALIFSSIAFFLALQGIYAYPDKSHLFIGAYVWLSSIGIACIAYAVHQVAIRRQSAGT